MENLIKSFFDGNSTNLEIIKERYGFIHTGNPGTICRDLKKPIIIKNIGSPTYDELKSSLNRANPYEKLEHVSLMVKEIDGGISESVGKRFYMIYGLENNQKP